MGAASTCSWQLAALLLFFFRSCCWLLAVAYCLLLSCCWVALLLLQLASPLPTLSFTSAKSDNDVMFGRFMADGAASATCVGSSHCVACTVFAALMCHKQQTLLRHIEQQKK